MRDPTSWIDEECIPDGFEWKDPSKIHKVEIFHLLDHWRACQDEGLEPLIWVPTSPLFKDTEKTMEQGQAIQQAKTLQPPPESDEEVFILSASDDFDLDEDGSEVASVHSDQSSQNHDSPNDGQAKSVESPGSDVHMNHSEGSFIGGSHMIVCCMLSIYLK